MKIDFQRVRHSLVARLIRRTVYGWLADPDSWPPTFRAPLPDDSFPVCADLYVHLPFCRQLCPHCPYNKTLYLADRHRRYGQALLAELKARPPDQIRSLYFGGGTPSATPDLIEMVLEHLRPGPTAEVAVEVHPSDATPMLLKRLRTAGVNRVSLGVETFEQSLLARLGRNYSPRQARRAIENARALDFDCLDANLIYGIPDQSAEQSRGDAELLLALGVDQISAYPLFTFVHTRMGRQGLPPVDDRVRLTAQKAIAETCLRGGLERTSVWSYTRSGLAPYTTVTRENYTGYGASAGSKVDGTFWFNTFSLEAYLENQCPALVMTTTPAFRRLHWLYWQIYCCRIDPDRYRHLFDRDLHRDFRGLLFLLRLLGMRRDTVLTERGAMWVHRLQMLYSLSYIDELWSQAQQEPWPAQIVLD